MTITITAPSTHREIVPRRFWRRSTHLKCSCGWFGYNWQGHVRAVNR